MKKEISPVFIKDYTGNYQPRKNNEIVLDKSLSWFEKMRRKISSFFYFHHTKNIKLSKGAGEIAKIFAEEEK